MVKLILIAACVAFVAVSTADPVHYDKITDEINKAVDQAIEAIEQKPEFDPMSVPDHEKKFRRKVGPIEFKGELNMRNIKLRGLKDMKRIGDASVINENGVIKAHLIVGVHNADVSMDYDFEFKLGKLHPNTHVISDIQDFEIEISLDVDDDGKMTLTDFEVRKFANVVNHIEGLSILNPVFGVLSKVLINIFQGPMRAYMTKVLEPAFRNVLENNPSLSFYY